MIHLWDTLHSLHDDKIWFQGLLKKIKEFLKVILNITPGILSKPESELNDNYSILSMFTQLH